MGERPDRYEQMTESEMKVLDKVEHKVDREIRREEGPQTKSDALVDALGLLDHLEEQKNKLERRELRHERKQLSQQMSDLIANFSGSTAFITVHIIVFGGWILLNTMPGLFGTTPFDPFPFMFLTLAVSLEAIFLSSFILLSQNRQASRDRSRDEIDFERDRLDLKVDTLAAKTIREATVKIARIERQLDDINKKLDAIGEKGAARPRKRK